MYLIFLLLFLFVISVQTLDIDECPSKEVDICDTKNLRCCAKAINDYECCTSEDYFDQFPKLSDAVAQPRNDPRLGPTPTPSSTDKSTVLGGATPLTIVGVVVSVVITCVTGCICCWCWCSPSCLIHKKFVQRGMVLRQNDQGQPLSSHPPQPVQTPRGSPRVRVI